MWDIHEKKVCLYSYKFLQSLNITLTNVTLNKHDTTDQQIYMMGNSRPMYILSENLGGNLFVRSKKYLFGRRGLACLYHVIMMLIRDQFTFYLRIQIENY